MQGRPLCLSDEYIAQILLVTIIRGQGRGPGLGRIQHQYTSIGGGMPSSGAWTSEEGVMMRELCRQRQAETGQQGREEEHAVGDRERDRDRREQQLA
jgi:hypothetical protein